MKSVIIKRFILSLLLISAFIFSIALPICVEYKQEVQDKVMANEEASVVSASQMIQKEMYEQLHILDMLTSNHLLTRYADTGSEQDRQQLERLFSTVSASYHRFDQIRLLDNTGFERIRINLNQGVGEAVPQSQLQDKSDRYYFKETHQLAHKQVFISRLDLNVESDQIEIPHKPMLRFSAPILDSHGDRAGVLVLNYLAKGMLDNFRRQMSQHTQQHGMLIDPQGYWLSHHKRSNEWGADLGQPEHTFANVYPKAWNAIVAHRSGTIETEEGFFRFQQVKPYRFTHSRPSHFRSEHQALLTPSSVTNTDWTLVVFVPHQYIASHLFIYQPLGQVLLGVMALLVIGASLLIAIVTTHRQVRAKVQQELHEVFSDLYDNAPCGYHSLDAQGKITRINQTELNWLGYSREQVIDQPFIDFLTKESKARFEVFFAALKAEQDLDSVVLEMQCKGGSTFYVSSYASSRKDASGGFAVARTSVFNITERIELERKLERLANLDGLTNISNRRHFYEQGNIELARAKRCQHTLAILMFDIDYFKRVNDTYGHDSGDKVLMQLAKHVDSELRELDIFARFGGEEFIALLPELPAEQVVSVAERLRQTTADTPIVLPSGESITITVSVGVAMLTPDDQLLDSLIKKADLALYQAKEQGRNRVVEYSAKT